MPTPCFWLEPTGDRQVVLRRYHSAEGAGWTCADGWHEAHSAPVAVEPDEMDEHGYRTARDDWDPDDPRWPVECAQRCGYRFTDDDAKQTFTAALYRRDDTGELLVLRDAPPGAMWDAPWMGRQGPDGRCLVARTPDGYDWAIDSRARNCGRPDDDVHRCWVRHGEPPRITVDKNGDTCSAGAGSIATGGYHGFLRDGVFT